MAETNDVKSTVDYYVEKHREMWRWIAETLNTAEEELYVSIHDLKREYCNEHGYELWRDCFLCECSRVLSGYMGCSKCPLTTQYDAANKGCLNGLYFALCMLDTNKDKAFIALQIAEVPLLKKDWRADNGKNGKRKNGA